VKAAEKKKRNNKIAFMALYDHMNLQEIADCFGLTREAVRQILVQEGIDYQVVLQRRRNLDLASQATVAGARVNTATIIQHGPGKGKKRPEYVVYTAMLSRCYNPKHPEFASYGGRGITVCNRWRGKFGYENFLIDMGQRPPGVYVSGRAKLSIHRKDNDGLYTPENCKWADQKEQCANRRRPVRKAKPKYALSPSAAESATE
jgi:hypothetical protein